jgi:hypothetical protein
MPPEGVRPDVNYGVPGLCDHTLRISMSRPGRWRKQFLLDTLDYTSGSIPHTNGETVQFKSHTDINKHPTDSSHHSYIPDAPASHRPYSTAHATYGTS